MKKAIHAPGASPAIAPYSPAIKSGNLLFISGQLPVLPDGSFPDDITGQTKQCLENLSTLLNAAGASLDNVVKCVVFIKDMNDFATINEAYGSYFNDTPPARSCVEVARLPRDARIEIEAIAVLED